MVLRRPNALSVSQSNTTSLLEHLVTVKCILYDLVYLHICGRELGSIAVSVFADIFIELTNTIRQQDPNNYSETDTRCLVYREAEVVLDLVMSGALAHIDNIHIDWSG